MPVEIGAGVIAGRLTLAVIAGLVIGFDRSEHGKAAGLRTTVLVCLAAAVAMVEVNLLLPTAGRASDSFVMNDLMRFPLGVLTGVGFIGAGAILRRGDLVVGVTTAATMWLVTIIGLCLGAGLIGLGLATTAIGLLALWGLKWLEGLLPRECRARLSLEIHDAVIGEAELHRRLSLAGLKIISTSVYLDEPSRHRAFAFELRHMRCDNDFTTPPAVVELAAVSGIAKLRWQSLQ